MLRLWDGVTPVQQGGLGEFIRTRRKQLGMSSQDDLADAAGVDQKKISNLEQGNNFRSPLPPPEIIVAVASALGVSTAELLRHAGYLTDDAQDVSAPLAGDAQIAELERIAREMGPDRIRAKREAIIESIIAALDDESAGHGTGS